MWMPGVSQLRTGVDPGRTCRMPASGARVRRGLETGSVRKAHQEDYQGSVVSGVVTFRCFQRLDSLNFQDLPQKLSITKPGISPRPRPRTIEKIILSWS